MNLLLSIQETNFYISDERWFDFLSRFLAYTISLFILIRHIFYRYNGQSKFLFVFALTGLMIFLISSSLDRITLNIGIALGLFAIFGIIRFRTPSVELKELTYLFISIGMAVINGLVEFNIANWFGLLIINLIILNAALIMERYKPKSIVFKKLLIFTPTSFNDFGNEELLIEEIKKSTGIDIFKVEVAKINKSKNEITAWIYFKDSENNAVLLPDEDDNLNYEDLNSTDWESNYTNDY